MTTTSPAFGSGDTLESLIGAELRSHLDPRIVYRLVSRVGYGAMSVAFYAQRITEQGEVGVVVKIMKPWFVQQWGATAQLIVQKESVALGRLNERVPPTPFVVRLIDTGSTTVKGGRGAQVDVPWLAVEYVHGGADGTTLSQRVQHSIRATGYAFDPHRAANLVEALGAGLSAVHEVGVIHRDIKPDNVLCCGFGDEEMFKIADFGVARPQGVAATFGGFIVGTMGFAAPELATMDAKAVGTWSDVFSMAAVVFYVLCGADYFDVNTPSDALLAALSPKRRSITDSPWLSPDLRRNAEACKAIDFALSCGTSGKTEVRPQRADALAMMIAPWLRAEAARASLIAMRRPPLEEKEDTTQLVAWRWSQLQKPGSLGRIVRDVAWDGDGRCMAATSEGLSFWNGAGWVDVSHEGVKDPNGIRFVRRTGPGQYLVGGDGGTFAMYTPEGPKEVRRVEIEGVRFEQLSGHIDDIAVLVGHSVTGTPKLSCLVSRRWLRPLPLPDVASIMALARIDDAKWLVVGRSRENGGYAAIYSPLDWEVRRIDTPLVRAFLAADGDAAMGLGLATGASGTVVWRYPDGVRHEQVAGKPDLSAATIDASGRGWTASAGAIWMHHRTTPSSENEPPIGRWELMWRDDSWAAPVVALFTEPGKVIGVTADGGVIEGRTQTQMIGFGGDDDERTGVTSSARFA